jgi:hypothetical protein
MKTFSNIALSLRIRRSLRVARSVAIHKRATMKSRSGPLSQWASGLGESIRFPRKQLKVPFVYDGGTIACILDYVSLWFILQRGELRVAVRICFDPQGIDSARVVTSSKNDSRFVVDGRTGEFVIHLQVLKEEREILHYKTKLTPHRPVQMVISARDLVFGGTGKNEDVEGKVGLTCGQRASAGQKGSHSVRCISLLFRTHVSE